MPNESRTMASKERKRKAKDEKVLRAVRPSAAITAEYDAKLVKLIREMQDSVTWFLKASYRKQEPRIMAEDESPADALRRTMKELAARWIKKFDTASVKLAEWFAQSVEKRSTQQLKKILKDGGLSVEFQMTPAMRDIMDATVNQNVALIRSIPQQYFLEVEGLVMRSVQTGRDMGYLSKEMQKRYGITRRRADFIARDQNEKATSAFNTARQLESGIDENEWLHSGGGRTQRPTHVKAGRERTRFELRKGWYDPAVKKYIWPGTEPNCRCVGKPILKGFS